MYGEKSDDEHKYRCIDHAMTAAFFKFGQLVSRHRIFFLLMPLVVAIVCVHGITCLTIQDDVVYLFTPTGSPGRADGEVFKTYFPSGDNETEFLPNRELIDRQTRGSIIVREKDDGDVLSTAAFREIAHLDELIRTFTFTSNYTDYSYSHVCQTWLHACHDNVLMSILRHQVEAMDHINLTFPFLPLPPPHEGRVFVGSQLGGVDLYPKTDVIKMARAMLLIYSVTRETREAEELAYEWEEHFIQEVDKFAESAEHIVISYETSFGLADEIGEASKRVIPLFVATFCMLVIFAVGSCIMRDWVQSKPWLGLIGVLSASLAIVSSIGFLSYCRVEFNELVSLMPFLIIGVGVDNMFIMIAGWRQLSIYLPVHERMGKTYSEAAVSITITNLTTILAFIIGASISLPAIRAFCIYAGVAMFFAYFYQITFFGACMAFTGEREAKNLHCYTCKKVVSKDESPNKLYMIFCAGGVPQQDSKCRKPEGHIIHPVMVLFRDYYGPFLMRKWVKLVAMGLFIAYLGGAIYGCMNIDQGLKLRNLARDGSPTWRFYKEYEDYFSDYGPVVSVGVTEQVDYWNQSAQDSLNETLAEIEGTHLFHGSEISVSWLRVYSQYLKAIFQTSEVDKDTFLTILQHRFLKDYRFKQFELDIAFEYAADNITAVDIKASRFLVTSRNMQSAMQKRDMMLEVREIAIESSFNIITFHPMFVVYDQYVGTIPNLFQTLGIAMACMMMVSLIMIPHPICAIFVTTCAISIDAAVIGYMSLWGVSLDTVSVINIILCIGFSVDFSAHITYSFVSAPDEEPNKRAIAALFAVGMPIAQGALSSMIALSPLATAPTYLFRTFFKTLFLAMSFGALHGLVFLPVILSFLGNIIPRKHAREEEVEVEKKDIDQCNIYINYMLEPPVIAAAPDNEFYVVETKISTV
ncbi:patched domain-containing protein 3 [Strongylocentrotus purpuratus]|uniref:SSD domain-containing protein n=1 Tax=Strongylocentrotus purpuratus TaxID=7668 RepID=A0A7M7SXL1_STRPU|nr:patched domain-containing protein 3 [Strongylocentrotus purpuratus]